MPQLRIRLLGSFQVFLDETPILNFESNKVRGLLAFLVVERQEAHRREKLAEMFWPDMPAHRAKSNLSQAVYNLRQIIKDHKANPPFLLRSRDMVQFNPESDYWLDLEVFSTQMDEIKYLDLPSGELNMRPVEALQAAVDLFRGGFIEDLVFDSSFEFDEWVLSIRQRVHPQLMVVLHQLAEICADQGEAARALVYARRQVEIDPLDERAARQLMILLAKGGQRSQALAVFERLKETLANELYLEPELETVELQDQIRGESSNGFQMVDKQAALPAFLTPLVGRRDELMELQTWLYQPDCRELTILGPGGSGKSRLALEVAHVLQTHFRHGAYFIPLNPVQSAVSIPPAVAQVLGLPRHSEENHRSQLINYLRGKKMLLVLDGFEHLLEGASWLAELLHQAPGIKALVTSRSRLNIKGENLYKLGGLRYPNELDSKSDILNADAIQLLIAGLRRVQQNYEPRQADFAPLVQVCRQVQGMPLGILLAASWGALLSPEEIAREVSQGLDFLAADWADVPVRQRSLRATFDHTWSLLAEPDRRVFKSISVFRGAFTREAAQEISGARQHTLRSLVDCSLLWNKNPGWYELHELLRQYGQEKLGQDSRLEQAAFRRHSEYYLNRLSRLEDDLKSAQQGAALDQIDLEHENFRAAWNWATTNRLTDLLSSAVNVLCLYYDLSFRHQDGESACQLAAAEFEDIQGDDAVHWLLARIFTWQSRFARFLGRLDMAHYLLDRALFCLRKIQDTGKEAFGVQAFLALEKGDAHFQHDRAIAASCYQHSLQIYRSLNDLWGVAKALAGLGLVAHHAGSFELAVQQYSDSLAFYRELGDPRGMANALVEMGHNTLRQGQLHIGQEYIQDGVAILQQIGDRAGAARGFLEIGRSCFWSGEFARGNAAIARSFPVLEDLGMRGQLAFGMIALSLGLSHQGKYTDAFTQAMRGLPLARELDARREIAMAYLFLGKACLGQGDYEQALNWSLKSVAEYKKIDQQDELGWGLALVFFAYRGLGDVFKGLPCLHQALAIGLEIHGYFPVLCGLYGIALLQVDQGEIERAVEIMGLAEQFPVAANSQWFMDVAGREIMSAAAGLSTKVAAAAKSRGDNLNLWETAAEMLKRISIKVS